MASFNPQIPDKNEPNYLGYSRGVSVPSNLKEQGVEDTSIKPRGVQFEVTPYKGPVYEGNKHVDEAGLYAGQAEGYGALAAGQAAGVSALAKGQAEGITARAAGEAAQFRGEATGAGLKAEGVGLAATGELIHGIAGIADMAAKEANFLFEKKFTDTATDDVNRERDARIAGAQIATGQTNKILAGGEEQDKELPGAVKKFPQFAENLKQGEAAGNFGQTHYLGVIYSKMKNLREQFPAYREFIDQAYSKAAGTNVANAYAQSMVHDLKAAMSAKKEKIDDIQKFSQSATGLKIPGIIELSRKAISGEIPRDEFWKTANNHMSRFAEAEDRDAARKVVAEDQADQQKKALDDATWFGTTEMTASVKSVKDLVSSEKVAGWATNPPDSKEVDSATQLLEIRKREGLQRFNDYMYNPEGPNGPRRPPILDLTPTQADAVRKQIVEPMQTAQDFLKDKQISPAFAVARMMEDRTNRTYAAALADKSLSDDLARLQIANHFGGQNAGAILSQVYPNLTKNLGAFTLSNALKSTTPPMTAGETPHTLDQELKEIRTKGIEDNGVNRETWKRSDMFLNPKVADESKQALANFYFDPKPENRMAFKLYGNDDLVNGRRREGKVAVFEDLTSKAKAEAITKLGPQTAANYTDWAQTQFGINAISEIQSLKGIQLAGEVAWNDKEHQLENHVTSPYARNKVNNVNRSLQGLVNVYRAQGISEDNIDGQLIRLLTSQGFKPSIASTGPNPQPFKDFGQQFFDSIASTMQVVKDAHGNYVKRKREQYGP